MNSSTKIITDGRISALKKLNRHLNLLAKDGVRKFFILTDEHTLDLCLPTLIYNAPVLENAEFLELPAGEACKEISIVSEVWKSLAASGADRKSIIVNLGGGCICDTGGFVAATYKRGIDFINVPTTLTAMVDAAIGGKTAINLDAVKNQVGCFKNPVITCIDPTFLVTLPDSELRSGEYEIMKILLLTGYESWANVCFDEIDYNDLILYCINFKQSVVKADPKEAGIRKILNFGHTFGHALEAYGLNHGKQISHGEAIGIGMLYALYLSTKKLALGKDCLMNYKSWLTTRVDIPKPSLKEIEELLGYMHDDKKNHDSKTLCVLLKSPGVPVIDVAVSDNEIRDTFLSAALSA